MMSGGYQEHWVTCTKGCLGPLDVGYFVTSRVWHRKIPFDDDGNCIICNEKFVSNEVSE